MRHEKGTSARCTALAAASLALLASAASGCSGGLTPALAGPEKASPVLGAEVLLPSPRLIVGRVIAVDAPQRFAIVEVASDAPAAALDSGAELMVRTLELRPTGKLEVSRYLRGRTLGTKIIAGQPSAGDEVVWLAP